MAKEPEKDMEREMELLRRARSYLSAMAEGRNPLTGEEEPEGSTLNEVRIARCLYYVVGVLDKVIDNSGVIEEPIQVPTVITVTEKRIKRNRPFSADVKELADIRAEHSCLTFTALRAKINEVIPADMKKLEYKRMISWLTAQGILERYVAPNGSNKVRPTKLGNKMGFLFQERQSQWGIYHCNLLETQAQNYILNHLSDIAGWNEELSIDPETGELLEES